MNFFQLFELPVKYQLDNRLLKKKFYALSRTSHPDTGDINDIEDQVLKASQFEFLNEAYNTLTHPMQRLHYLLLSLSIIGEDEQYTLSPAFLMDMMELNELVLDDESEAAKQILEVNSALKSTVVGLLEKENWTDLTDAEKISLKDFYFKQKYIERIQKRITKFANS